MATIYGTRWTVTFKDRNNTTRVILIQQAGWDGDVTEVMPGNDPLIIDEESSEDLNKRVRGITGRLEVVEENYGDLTDMFPKWNLQMKVVCSGVFIGYIKAQNSTNTWCAGPRTLKFNVQSPLALANDIKMPLNTTMGLREMGSVMSDLLTTMGYDRITMPNGTAMKGDFFRGSIRGMLICPYANDRDYHYEHDSEVFAPISCGELLEAICVKHDLICHDYTATMEQHLLFQRLREPGVYYSWTTANITAGNYDTSYTYNYGETLRAMNTDFINADDSNSEQLVRPYSTITVKHEGERGDERVKAPTEQSEYVTNTIYDLLRPRGIWLNVVDQNIMMRGESLPKPETTGSDADDYEIVDELDINTQNAYGDKTLLFSVTFYNIDPGMLYRFKFSYKKSDEVINTGFWLSARGKSGWYYGGAGQDYHPIATTEQFIPCSLNSDTDSHGRTANLYMIADEWITINVYSESGLKAVKVWDMRLEGKLYSTEGFKDRYEALPFASQLIGNGGGKDLTINQMLNNTYFSNYYQSSLAFSSVDYGIFLSSQRRLRYTVRGQFTMFWYLYKYYINNQSEWWKIIAVSRNVRDNSYTLTFHNF